MDDPWPLDPDSGAANVLDRVRDGVVVLDGDLRYAYLNARAEEIVGASRADLLGEHVWDVFPASAASVARPRMEQVRESGTPTSYERYNAEVRSHVRVDIYPHGDGLVLVFADVTEQKASTRRLDRLLETAPVGLVVVDAEGAIRRANPRAERLLGLERSEIESRTYHQPEWEIWDEDGDPVTVADHPVTRVLVSGEPILGFTHGISLPDGTERWLSSNCAPVRDDEGDVVEVVVALEDVTDLKRLDRFIRLLRPVDDLLNSATGRRELERGVCETLASTPLYDVAWLASPRPGTDEPERRAWAGDGDLRPETVDTALRDTGALSSAIATATVDREVQVLAVDDVTPTAADPDGADAALTGRVALVPLVHEREVHGVVGLFTGRSDPFARQERRLLAALGERVARVLTALATRSLLHADTVVELVFRSTDRHSLLIRVSATLDCALTVDGTILVDGETVLYYLTIEGAGTAAVADALAAEASVRAVRPVRESDDALGGQLEVETTGRSLAQALIGEGARVTTDEVIDGTATVVCEVTPETDVSGLVGRITEGFPDTDLVAKRERDREGVGPQSRLDALATVVETELTDHQRRALRAAYHAGYFQSPRRSSASVIAEALSITQPTFSYHLRNAERAVFDRLFESL